MRTISGIFPIAMMLGSIAYPAEAKVPAKLYRVDGKPVPASCLEALVGPSEGAGRAPIDLRTCGNPNVRPKVQADGSIGYATPDGGYFYYSYLGRSDGIDILSLQNSGGGTGRFTQLVGVKQNAHRIMWVKDIAGGDRCNGGISGETVANGILSFDQAITPYDLVDLAHPRDGLKPYRDLEASTMSCVASVHHVNDAAHWTRVSLTADDWQDQPGWTEQYTYQSCFNALYREAVRQRRTKLDRQGVETFSQAFVRRCVLK